jgi:lambda family phage tail tape measure protein
MATIENFILRFSTQNEGSLDRTDEKVKKLRGSFAALAQVIGGLALGAFINDSIKAANAMTDLADATNISLQSIVGLTQALAANGGTADRARDGISDLVKNLGEAANGSGELQKAFATVGVSLEDLRTLSEEDILRKTIQGLANIPDSARRTSTAFKLMGESVKGVDIVSLNRQLDDSIRNSRDSAEATRAAADANRRLTESINNLKQGAVNALEPILKLLGDQNVSVETATKLFQTLGAIMGVIYGAKMIAGIVSLVNLLKTMNVVLKGQVVLQTALTALGGPKGLAMIAASAAAAVSANVALNQILKQNNQELEKSGKIAAGTSTAGAGRGGMGGPTAEELAAYRKSQETVREVVDANEKAIQETRQRTIEAGANAERILRLSTANDIKKIEIDRDFEIAKVRREIQQKEKELGINLAAEQAARIKEIQVQAEVDTNEVRRRLMLERFEEEERQRREIEERIRQVDAERQSAYDTIDVLREQTKILGENSLLSRELVDASDEERRRKEQILAIEQQRRASLTDIKRLTLLPEDERLRREQEINAEYDRRIGLINEESQAIQRREQDFAAGFRDTMRRYEQSLTPLKRGEEFANSVFRNMDSALSNFVNNGKFNFKDFATSVIRDLVLIELRANTVALFRNVLGAAGTALGFRAMGGPVTAGQPYVVGERGAELFVPSTSGTIVPNLGTSNAGALGGSSNVVYNINAVDALSFKQLVARDPSFIFAVTEQGRKSVPSTRR